MCGIVGFNWRDEALVKKMADSIKHRGPDDEGSYVDDRVSLGHRRLSIIDLSESGRQPMVYHHEGRTVVITYNGEIYNYREVRAELEAKGHRFHTHTDTEVIPAAYLEWGPDAVTHMNGMWAFAIYDPAKQQIFLSRDRFGEKPIYYHLDGEQFVFASEIKAILHHPISRRANSRVVSDYLFHGLANNGPESFFEGIVMIPPAHNAVFDLNSGKLKLNQYYKPTMGSRHVGSEEFLETLKRAVQSRLIADVPIGISLSSGTDSPSVAALTAALSDSRIKAFTTANKDGIGDETRLIQDFLDQYPGIDLERSYLSEQSFLTHYRDIVYHLDEPFARQSAYVRWEIANITHRHQRKVLLNGEGVDEILGGYAPFSPYFFGHLASHHQYYRFLSEAVQVLLHPERKVIIDASKKYRSSDQGVNQEHVQNKQAMQQKFGIKLQPRFQAESKRPDLKGYLYHLVSESSLPRLLNCNDKMTMANSVEARAPFLDHEFVNMCFEMDPKRFIVGGRRKYPLREAMKSKVPASILLRRKKDAFHAPVFDFLRNATMQQRIEELFNEEPRSAAVFDPKAYLNEYQRFLGRRGANQPFILHGLLLEEWSRTFKVDFA